VRYRKTIRHNVCHLLKHIMLNDVIDKLITDFIKAIKHLLQSSASFCRQLCHSLPTVIQWPNFSVLEFWLHCWFNIWLPAVILICIHNGHLTMHIQWSTEFPYDSNTQINSTSGVHNIWPTGRISPRKPCLWPAWLATVLLKNWPV